MNQRTIPLIARRGPQNPFTQRTALRRRPKPAAAAAAPKRLLTVDRGLTAAGLMSAMASCAFAVVMIAQNNGPSVPHTNYFSVYAQLRGKTFGGGRKSTVAGNDDVDPLVTGSLKLRSATPANAPPAGTVLQGFSVREVFDSTVLLDTPTGLQIVKRGATLVGAGPVTDVERRGSRVIVTTPKGIVWMDAD